MGAVLVVFAVLWAGSPVLSQRASDSDASHATAHSMIGVEERQVVYVDEGLVLHFIAPTGKYELLSIVSNHPQQKGKCPGLSNTSVYKGQLPFRFRVASPFGPRSVIFHDPLTGDFAIWTCKAFNFEMRVDAAAPCTVDKSGTFNPFVGVTNVIRSRNLTLAFNSNAARIQVFNHTAISDGSEDQYLSSFFTGPIATFHESSWLHRKLFSLGNNYIFDHSSERGDYRVWQLDYFMLKVLGPTARGSVPSDSLLHFSWLGDDRLFAVSDSGEYNLLRFDASQLGFESALPLVTIGRGSLDEAPCQYSNCEDCAGDSRCGWCFTARKCLPGNMYDSCNDGTGVRCASWMYGYCASSSCFSRQFRSNCVSDHFCGWCESTGLCVPVKDGVGIDCASGNVTLSLREFSGDRHR